MKDTGVQTDDTLTDNSDGGNICKKPVTFFIAISGGWKLQRDECSAAHLLAQNS